MVRPVADSSRPHFFTKSHLAPARIRAASRQILHITIYICRPCSRVASTMLLAPSAFRSQPISMHASAASPNSLFCFPKRPVLLPQTGCLGYQSGLRRKSPTFRLFCNPPASCCCFATCVTLVLAASPGHGPGHGRWRVANPPQRGRECEPQSGGGSASRKVGRARVSHNV